MTPPLHPCRVVLFVICAALGLVPAVARGDWQDFLPYPVENGAIAEGIMTYERDHNRVGDHSVEWDDLYFREKLTAFSNGYSYHPRFLQYRFSLTGVLKQEEYDSSSTGSTGWREGTGMEYDTRLTFLPEHPYSLLFYARRLEPMYKVNASPTDDTIDTNTARIR
jgi:hypothetical protein